MCMPKLNTENPQVKEYTAGGRGQVDPHGIDGWRLDVAIEVDSHFWQEFRQTVHAINRTQLSLESSGATRGLAAGDQFDG